MQNISISKKDVTHNFLRYNILTKNKKIHIKIRGVEGSVDKFTAGIYDFINDKILHYEDYVVSDKIDLYFATGENIDGIAFCIYAGICGKTQGKEISIERIEVFVDEL